MTQLSPLRRALIEAAIAGGHAAMSVYRSDFQVSDKDDKSPVTEADHRAETVILERLAALEPDLPVVAEEQAAAGLAPSSVGRRFALVDPVDGTKDFIKKTGEWTVNIAIIEDGLPVAGVVYAPAIQRLFHGEYGLGAAHRVVNCEESREGPDEPIEARIAPKEALIAVASKSHRTPETDDYLAMLPVSGLKSMGSSLKLCLLAAGEADVYPRLGRTMEWDIAAGHGVLRAAGGSIELMDGAPFTYGKPGFENPHFVAWGRRG